MIADGTYLVKQNGEIVNYGERWNFGFFVADGRKGFRMRVADMPEIELGIAIGELSKISSLVGVWTDPNTGIVYIDPVTHVADYETAIALGKENGELAIWDAFKGEEIYL